MTLISGFRRKAKRGAAQRPASGLIASPKTGEQPYAGLAASQVSAYRLAAAQGRPAPAYHPAKGSAPETAPMPVLREDTPAPPFDPFDPATAVTAAVRPVIGDSLPALPPDPEPPAAPEPGSSPVLYAGLGWARRLMSMRVANGEWEDVRAIAERGFGRNAADEAAARRHSREVIAEGMLMQLAAIGHPELAAPLLYRTHELVTAARAAAAEVSAR